MRGLTARQKQVLSVIEEYIVENGYPPSVREIGDCLGLSSSCTVQRHLEALIGKGYLRRSGSKARTLELTESAGGTRSAEIAFVPLVGRVAAGAPVLAEEHVEEQLPIAKALVGEGAFFALKVRGDSMIEAGLFEGDTVIVRQQPTAHDGEIVVALVDGSEATVKRLLRRGNRVGLKPENPTMEPFFPEQVEVLGKVVLSIRHFS